MDPADKNDRRNVSEVWDVGLRLRSMRLKSARCALHVVEAKFSGQTIFLRRRLGIQGVLHRVSERPHPHRLQTVPYERQVPMNIIVEVELRTRLIRVQYDDRNHCPPAQFVRASIGEPNRRRKPWEASRRFCPTKMFSKSLTKPRTPTTLFYSGPRHPKARPAG